MPFQIPRSRIPQSQTPRPIDTDPLAASRATQRGVAQIGQDIQQIGQSILQIELTQEANAQRKQAQESAERQRETAGIQRGILRDADEKRSGRDKVASARAVTATQGEAASLVQEIENLSIDDVDQDGRDDALSAYLDQLDQSHEERVQDLPERLRPGLEAVYLEQRQRFAAAASQAYESRLAARDQVLENDYYRELGSTVQSPNGAIVAYEAFKSVYPESDRAADLLRESLISLAQDGQAGAVLEGVSSGQFDERLGAAERQSVESVALQQIERDLRGALSSENLRRLSTIDPDEALTDFSGALDNKLNQFSRLLGILDQPGVDKALGDFGMSAAREAINDGVDLLVSQGAAYGAAGLALGEWDQTNEFVPLPPSFRGQTSTYIQSDPARQSVLASGDTKLISDLILRDTHKLHYMDPFYAGIMNQWFNSGQPQLVDTALSIVGEVDRSFNDAFIAPVRSAADDRSRRSSPQSEAFTVLEKLNPDLIKAARDVSAFGVAGKDDRFKKSLDKSRTAEVQALIEESVTPEELVSKSFWPDPDFSRGLGDWARRTSAEVAVRLGENLTKNDIVNEVRSRFLQEWGIPQIGEAVYRRMQPHNVIREISEDAVYSAIQVEAAEKGISLEHSPIFEWVEPAPGQTEGAWLVTQVDPVSGLRVGVEDPSSPGKTWTLSPSDLTERGPAKDMMDLVEAENELRLAEGAAKSTAQTAPPEFLDENGNPTRTPGPSGTPNPAYELFQSQLGSDMLKVGERRKKKNEIDRRIELRKAESGEAGFFQNLRYQILKNFVLPDEIRKLDDARALLRD